jgi:hypothetical protein
VRSLSIFGREPAAVIAAVGSVLTVLAVLNLDFFTAGQTAAITSLVSAGVMAWTTRPVAPALLTGFVAAAAALFAEYELVVSDEVVAAISGAVLTLFALITRQQVAPVERPVLTSA